MSGVKILVIILAIIVGLVIIVTVAGIAYKYDGHISEESTYMAEVTESLS